MLRINLLCWDSVGGWTALLQGAMYSKTAIFGEEHMLEADRTQLAISDTSIRKRENLQFTREIMATIRYGRKQKQMYNENVVKRSKQ